MVLDRTPVYEAIQTHDKYAFVLHHTGREDGGVLGAWLMAHETTPNAARASWMCGCGCAFTKMTGYKPQVSIAVFQQSHI
jgi:hypothetical protein